MSRKKNPQTKAITIDPHDTPEAIAELAGFLEQVETAEQLSALQEVPEFTPDRLRAACKHLKPKQLGRIKQFAIANKQSKENHNSN